MSTKTTVCLIIDGLQQTVSVDTAIEMIWRADRECQAAERTEFFRRAEAGWLITQMLDARVWPNKRSAMIALHLHHNRFNSMLELAREVIDPLTGKVLEDKYIQIRTRALRNHEDGVYTTRLSPDGEPTAAALEFAATGVMPSHRAWRSPEQGESAQLRTNHLNGGMEDAVRWVGSSMPGREALASPEQGESAQLRTNHLNRGDSDPFDSGGASVQSLLQGRGPSVVGRARPADAAATRPAAAPVTGEQLDLPFHLAETARTLPALAERLEQHIALGLIGHDHAEDLQARMDSLARAMEDLLA